MRNTLLRVKYICIVTIVRQSGSLSKLPQVPNYLACPGDIWWCLVTFLEVVTCRGWGRYWHLVSRSQGHWPAHSAWYSPPTLLPFRARWASLWRAMLHAVTDWTASSTQPQLWQTKMSPDFAKSPLGRPDHPGVENHCSQGRLWVGTQKSRQVLSPGWGKPWSHSYWALIPTSVGNVHRRSDWNFPTVPESQEIPWQRSFSRFTNTIFNSA